MPRQQDLLRGRYQYVHSTDKEISSENSNLGKWKSHTATQVCSEVSWAFQKQGLVFFYPLHQTQGEPTETTFWVCGQLNWALPSSGRSKHLLWHAWHLDNALGTNSTAGFCHAHLDTILVPLLHLRKLCLLSFLILTSSRIYPELNSLSPFHLPTHPHSQLVYNPRQRRWLTPYLASLLLLWLPYFFLLLAEV